VYSNLLIQIVGYWVPHGLIILLAFSSVDGGPYNYITFPYEEEEISTFFVLMVLSCFIM
jgi:hypothetical protein